MTCSAQLIPDFHAPTALDPAALTAARRYAVLQPSIVDKRPLFEAMVRLVAAGGGAEPGRVVEPGVGTGGFLEEIARQGVWRDAMLIGCDRSAEHLSVARERLAMHRRDAALCAGVDALDPADPFYTHMAPAGSADVVALAQFEHYAPNGPSSPLARRLDTAGRGFVTKSALRRLAVSRLRPGGWFFVIDDYAADLPADQAAWDRAWDAHVVQAFGRDDLWRALTAIDPEWAATFARKYDPARPWADRLALAGRARTRRRHRDGEEIQSLTAACRDFGDMFGNGNWGLVRHPKIEAHPQFHLLWGRVH